MYMSLTRSRPLFADITTQQLKYKRPFKIRTWGYPRELWLTPSLPVLSSRRPWAMLLHLSPSPRTSFMLWDADNLDNAGYIPNNASVYLTTVSNESGGHWIHNNPIIFDRAYEYGFVEVAYWPQKNSSNDGEPLKFTYKATDKDIVEC